MLKPSASFFDLFPSETVFAPRSTAAQMRWVFEDAETRLDAGTGLTMAVMGAMPLICHSSVATKAGQNFFRHAGVELPENLHTYDCESDFLGLVTAFVQQGKRLAYIYPPVPELINSPALLNSVEMYNWLNDKSNLETLVPETYLPESAVYPATEMDGLLSVFPGASVFIKACHPGASGAGTDVWYCAGVTDREAALAWLTARRDGLSGVRVEREVRLDHCWCLNLAIRDHDVCYLGAAEQLFSSQGKQSGSRIDVANPPPESAIGVARNIAELAREHGYRGIVGFDIGVSPHGGVYVFDLNFRMAASTPMVLMHESACRRIDATVSQSWTIRISGSLEDHLVRLAPYAEEGRFVPFRLSESSGGCGDCTISGMVVGNAVPDIDVLAQEITHALRR